MKDERKAFCFAEISDGDISRKSTRHRFIERFNGREHLRL